MSISHANAVLRLNRHQASATPALKCACAFAACAFAVLVVLLLTAGVARAAGINPNQPIRLDGLDRRQCAGNWQRQDVNSALSILASAKMSAGSRS